MQGPPHQENGIGAVNTEGTRRACFEKVIAALSLWYVSVIRFEIPIVANLKSVKGSEIAWIGLGSGGVFVNRVTVLALVVSIPNTRARLALVVKVGGLIEIDVNSLKPDEFKPSGICAIMALPLYPQIVIRRPRRSSEIARSTQTKVVVSRKTGMSKK